MVALILADGDVPTRPELDAAWPDWDRGIDLVVAADGGARHAAGLGVTPDLWVGDADSIEPAELASLAAAGVAIERSAAAKDESDTELAIRAALARGRSGIVILGALGGPRIDHVLANIGLLAMPQLVGRTATILDGAARIRLVQAPGPDGGPVEAAFRGRPGDLVTLLPVGGDVEGVSTAGLAYPLHDEPLAVGPARGLSNVRTGPEATVTIRRGRLLVIETPATL